MNLDISSSTYQSLNCGNTMFKIQSPQPFLLSSYHSEQKNLPKQLISSLCQVDRLERSPQLNGVEREAVASSYIYRIWR